MKQSVLASTLCFVFTGNVASCEFILQVEFVNQSAHTQFGAPSTIYLSYRISTDHLNPGKSQSTCPTGSAQTISIQVSHNLLHSTDHLNPGESQSTCPTGSAQSISIQVSHKSTCPTGSAQTISIQVSHNLSVLQDQHKPSQSRWATIYLSYRISTDHLNPGESQSTCPTGSAQTISIQVSHNLPVLQDQHRPSQSRWVTIYLSYRISTDHLNPGESQSTCPTGSAQTISIQVSHNLPVLQDQHRPSQSRWVTIYLYYRISTNHLNPGESQSTCITGSAQTISTQVSHYLPVLQDQHRPSQSRWVTIYLSYRISTNHLNPGEPQSTCPTGSAQTISIQVSHNLPVLQDQHKPSQSRWVTIYLSYRISTDHLNPGESQFTCPTGSAQSISIQVSHNLPVLQDQHKPSQSRWATIYLSYRISTDHLNPGESQSTCPTGSAQTISIQVSHNLPVLQDQHRPSQSRWVTIYLSYRISTDHLNPGEPQSTCPTGSAQTISIQVSHNLPVLQDQHRPSQSRWVTIYLSYRISTDHLNPGESQSTCPTGSAQTISIQVSHNLPVLQDQHRPSQSRWVTIYLYYRISTNHLNPGESQSTCITGSAQTISTQVSHYLPVLQDQHRPSQSRWVTIYLYYRISTNHLNPGEPQCTCPTGSAQTISIQVSHNLPVLQDQHKPSQSRWVTIYLSYRISTDHLNPGESQFTCPTGSAQSISIQVSHNLPVLQDQHKPSQSRWVTIYLSYRISTDHLNPGESQSTCLTGSAQTISIQVSHRI